MEDRVRALENVVSDLKEREADHRARIAAMDVRVESMHRDFDRVVNKLEEIHKSIQPLTEWSSKSKGSLATLGALMGLVLVVLGALASQFFKRVFEGGA